ncbi:MAG: hypothetical protein COT17_06460 [Elusimicrobia bacterium CG08_land_8_20_14_0_20_51_18]|nr:MAG: hypothetical protein COT17_06460 [Elusimicrobia bacterium CG08_land_8_20_14_0_20_51_18]
MLKLILKDKNFELGEIRTFLKSLGRDPDYFIKNYGELAAGSGFTSLLELKKKASGRGFNCGIIENGFPVPPAAEKVFKPDIEGEFLRLGGEKPFSVNFSRIKLLALGFIKKEIPSCSPFRPGEPPEAEKAMLGVNRFSSDASFYLEILAEGTPAGTTPLYGAQAPSHSPEPEWTGLSLPPITRGKGTKTVTTARFVLASEETDYSYLSRTGRKDPASEPNFRLFLSDLLRFSGKAKTNKTLDLFLGGKNIQYFIHEDYPGFEKELGWLYLVNKF